MLNNLEDYLAATCPLEQQTLLLDAYRALTQAGLDAHELPAEEIVLLYGSDRNVALDKLTQLLEHSVEGAIQSFGMSCDGFLSLKTRLFVALDHGIDDFENVELIDSLIVSEGSNEEVLSDILSAVTGLQHEEILPHLHDVSPSLLDRIAIINTAKLPVPGEDNPAKLNAIERFKKWLEGRADRHGLIAYQAILEGQTFGQDFSDLLTPYWEPIEALPQATQKAAELAGLALISDLPNAMVVRQVSDALELMDVNGMEFGTAIAPITQFIPTLTVSEPPHA